MHNAVSASRMRIMKWAGPASYLQSAATMHIIMDQVAVQSVPVHAASMFYPCLNRSRRNI